MPKTLVALSGGVDSSVAAALLKEQGCELVGAYMKNWINEVNVIGNCPWQQDIEDARAVADKLGIEFRVVNLMEEYKSRVVRYLLEGYQEGITPNPDVMCNREMKFGVFLDYALREGFGAVATGHYARTLEEEDGSRNILEGADKNKDQSYFLALLQQHQVRHARFPVGGLQKPEVRKIAAKYDLLTAAKKDSQGICFIGEVKMSDFLRSYVPDSPGPIVTQSGKTVGTHQGLHLYTLGQRKGIRVASNTPNEAYVVVEKRKAANELVVAFDRPDTPGLYATRCRVTHLSFTNRTIDRPAEILAKPRYRAASSPITFAPDGEGNAEVTFHRPQRALAPGQICALYDGEILLGGGIFSRIH